jgi:phospholipase C
MMRRRLPQVLCALGAAAVLAAAAGPMPGAGAAAHAPAPAPAIQHVIVVMQSGHSFDNYFGTRRGVDGIPANACQPLAANSVSCDVKPYHLSLDQARAGLTDNLSVTQKAINKGKMNGFVSAQSNTAIGSVAMGYLNGNDLPYYSSLASRFTLFDHFYAASQAGALPNRLASVAATAGGLTSNQAPGGVISTPTIFDRLDAAGLGWKYYVQGYQAATPTHPVSVGDQVRTPLLAMPSVTSTPARAGKIVNSSQYYVDLAKGQLPAVSYVTGSVDSERSPQNPTLGEAFVRTLVNALMQSSAWRHTVLLLTYDDSGGWYDHSLPPTIGGTQVGLRVPAILVSPYARAGYVDSTQLDTASIPAMIESVFHLPPLTAQDASSKSILTAVDTHQQPIAPAISPSGAAAVVVPRPAVATIYLLYGLALVGAGVLIALAFVRFRRDPLISAEAPPSPEAPE